MSAPAGDETGDSVSTGPMWTSPVLLIHADDDRNVPFRQTVALEQRLMGQSIPVEVQVIPDDIHDFLLFRSWKILTTAVADYFERTLLKPAATPPAQPRPGPSKK